MFASTPSASAWKAWPMVLRDCLPVPPLFSPPWAQRALVEVQRRGTELIDSARTRTMVVELAVDVARRVLAEAWSAAPEQWARACADAIEPLRQARGLTLRVAPRRSAGTLAATILPCIPELPGRA